MLFGHKILFRVTSNYAHIYITELLPNFLAWVHHFSLRNFGSTGRRSTHLCYGMIEVLNLSDNAVGTEAQVLEEIVSHLLERLFQVSTHASLVMGCSALNKHGLKDSI